MNRLLGRVRGDFLGLDPVARTADGVLRRRNYLDSAATSLMLRVAHDTAAEFLRHNASSHSRVHASARAATEACELARRRVLSFVGADPDRYLCLFVGAGATGALNRAAHYLRGRRDRGAVVVASLMEHHSNDLPHRRNGRVVHAPLCGEAPALGAVGVAGFAALLRSEPVQYAAVTLASNVTGIINPVARLTAAAHDCGVPIVVDASQAVAHLPIDLGALGDPDVLVFSGHKVYAPGSPGVLIVRRELVEDRPPAELGGGMVTDVSRADFTLAEALSEREAAGTPDIVGAVTLAAALDVLDRIGMEAIAEHEQALTGVLLDELGRVESLRIYGAVDRARCPRVGVASFNLGGLDHGFVAAVLNDRYNIAVRNGCFCAQPYARALLAPELWALDLPDDPDAAERAVHRRRGMVRASLGLYTTRDDILQLAAALREIVRDASRLQRQYRVDERGDYRHRQHAPPSVFDLSREVAELLARPVADAADQPAIGRWTTNCVPPPSRGRTRMEP